MPYPSRTAVAKLDSGDTSLTEQGVVCMDSWIAGTCTDNVITGLSHLEGKEVGVLVDDAWTGLHTVEDGMVTLSDDAITDTNPYNGVSTVGLMYEGEILTFEMATGNARGVSLGTLRRWNKLVIRLLDSALPKVQGQLPADRNPTSYMSLAETIVAGIVNRKVRNLGWNDGNVTIVQDRPYPTHIIGLYGEFNSENS
jgi:hypothetical protein